VPDVDVAGGSCAELELDDVGLRVTVRQVGSVVWDPEERDTDIYRVWLVGLRLNGKRVGSIVPVDLAHGLIVVHRDASHGSLHILEETVVQARCTIVLLDDNSDEAVWR
jgi:hypothetical protein